MLPALPNSHSNPDPRSTRCTIATSLATEAEAVPRGRRQKSATQGNVFFSAAAGAVEEEEGTRVVGAEGSCECEGTRVVVESCEGVMIMLGGWGIDRGDEDDKRGDGVIKKEEGGTSRRQDGMRRRQGFRKRRSRKVEEV